MPKPEWHLFAGTWRGVGAGSYPSVGTFEYVEETTFRVEHEWNMVSVLQKTWRIEKNRKKGQSLHLEAGLIVPKDDDSLEYGCAQDSGRIETMVGRPIVVSNGSITIDWATTAHGNDERLRELGRQWTIDGDVFTYRAFLSTVSAPEYRQHLEARLDRIER